MAGKYKIASGNVTCSNCLAGQYSTAVGATYPDVCQECPSNSDGPEASDEEVDCTCQAGFSGPGGGLCTECVAGTYTATRGNANCQSCPANSDSYAGSITITACSCNAGSTGPDGGLCTECVAGTYTTTRGNASCQSCPANSDSSAGSITITACTCNAGSTGPDGWLCTECVAGTYTTTRGNNCASTCGDGILVPADEECDDGDYVNVISASVVCSGSCACNPLSGAASGSISDGPSNYDNNEDCEWTIATESANASIWLSFSSFNTESGYDFVKIYSCLTSSCMSKEQVARLSGDALITSGNTTYTSSTGYMHVVFETDFSVIGSGFVAQWSGGPPVPVGGDGCSRTCEIEDGWSCTTEDMQTSICTEVW